jgi:hypothetical protein
LLVASNLHKVRSPFPAAPAVRHWESAMSTFTITVEQSAVELVPSSKGDGGIYVNATKGRSVKGTITFPNGETRQVFLRTVVVAAPEGQKAPPPANNESKAGDTAEQTVLMNFLQRLDARLSALESPKPLAAGLAGIAPPAVQTMTKRGKK